MLIITDSILHQHLIIVLVCPLNFVKQHLMIVVQVFMFDLVCYSVDCLHLFCVVLDLMHLPLVVYRVPILVCQMPLVVYLMPLVVCQMPSVVYQMPLVVMIIYAICYIASLHIRYKTHIADKCLCEHDDACFCGIYKGGYKLCPVVYDDVKDYIINEHCSKIGLESSEFKYIGYMHRSNTIQYEGPQYIHVLLPLQAHVGLVRLVDCYKIAKEHDIAAGKNTTLL
jgi:hypothetical protein